MKRFISFGIAMGIVVLMVISCSAPKRQVSASLGTKGKHPSRAFLATDYFKFSEGYGLKYHVTDEYGNLACDVWAVFQKVPDSSDYDYILTLTKNGTKGGYYGNSTLGGSLRNFNGKRYYCFWSGMPSGGFFEYILLPLFMKIGDTFSVDYFGECSIEDGGTVVLGGKTFNNCLRINISKNVKGRDYSNGKGYFILAPDVGIIKIKFTRSNSGKDWANTTVTYEYAESTTFTPHSISGTITTDGTTPAKDVYIQISYRILNKNFVTNSSGNYSIANIYGPDIQLYLGYDGNDKHNGILDFDYPGPHYPKKIFINNITNDITNMDINLSSL